MKKALKSIVILIFLGAIVAYVFDSYRKSTQPKPVVLQGQLSAQETNISAKVSGRIEDLFVKQGDILVVGSPILAMDSPEIEAKVAQAEAVRDAASAIADKASAGARSQEIQMAYEQMQRAKAGLDVYSKTWQRVRKLTQEGLLSKQKADEAKAQYISAQKQYETAKAQHNMAQEGARKEDIAAANAKARQGQAVVDEALVARSEAKLKSPVAGEVAEVIPRRGEIIAKGVPILTVIDLQEQRLELNVREDYLRFFTLKSKFQGDIPALGLKNIVFTVYASSVLPDFATWRPTRSDQGFDMRTFLVKSRPLTPIENMRPGMSVLVQLPDPVRQ